MKKISKRLKNLHSILEDNKIYDVESGINKLKSIASAKFNETVDVALRLGVDPRHADQMIRGAVILPHGTGKKIRVAVFAKGLKADEAREAGADIVGSDDLVESIEAGNLDFEIAIATPDMMALVGKLGKILGPKGLMPNPKLGTITMDVSKAIKNAKSGQVNFRVDKSGNIHAPLGKVNFESNQIKDNLFELVRTINKLKPSALKGKYIRHVSLSLTMSPSLEINSAELIDIK